MTLHIGRLVSDYGYLIVALFVFAEGIAIPFPTDTTVVTAAAFAAHGRLSIVLLFLVSTVAASLGTTVAFLGGRRGSAFFDRHAKRVNPAVLASTRKFFDRHGESAVMIGRFVPVARMLISPLAGLSSMSVARFTVFNVLGAAIWSAAFCGLGYFFGQHPPALGRGLVRGAIVLAVGLGILVTVAMAGGWLVEDGDAAWRAEGTIWHSVLRTPPLRFLAARSPRARAFLFRRISPADYLGLNLTIGLVLSVAAFAVFRAITTAVLAHDAVPQFDLDLAMALRDEATPASLTLWTSVSHLGALPFVALLGTGLALWLSWRRASWLPVIGFTAAMLGGATLDLLIEYYYVHPHVAATAQSAAVVGAPSGQALVSLVGYGMVAYFLVLMAPGHRTRVLIGTLASEMASVGHLGFLFTSILPHGVPELSGLFVSGSAGLLAGYALINPGRRKRSESLKAVGKDMITLVATSIVLMFIAAPIEGFFSFNPNVPVPVKLAFVAVELLAWGAFWTFFGRGKSEVGRTSSGSS